MVTHGLEKIVAAHPLFRGLDEAFFETVAGCAKNVRFAADTYLFHEGEEAKDFYLIREGHVAKEISSPGQGRMVFQTVTTGGAFGISAFAPPYRWGFDAIAREDVRAIVFDTTCLRTKCEADPALGYAMMKHFLSEMVERLHDTRVQMLDLYRARS
jgi:CRP-like cAMP-binding protein